MSRRRLVVEADGGARGNPGPAAYGAVVRDAKTGEALAEIAEPIGVATNNVAEYRGLVAGLTAAREIDPDAVVEARLDSKLVVEQMSGNWQIKHPALKPLAIAAHRAFPPDRVRYRWVPRAQNAHADRLLNEALDRDAGREAGRAAADSPPATDPQPAGERLAVDEAEVEPVPPPPAPAPLVGWAKPLGPPTRLVLLRHGSTAFTVEKRFSGSGTDPGLAERGRREAERAAPAIAERWSVDVVIASPLRRAVETAAIAAQALGQPVQTHDGFRECDFGAWDGYTFAEIEQRWPAELATWLGSTGVAPPGGESLDAVAERVAAAHDQVLKEHAGQTVLVVSHVTPIKMLVRFALGAPVTALFRMELEPASVTLIDWYGDTMASMRAFNDVSHLR
jgi:ribonuclease H / adenosylcobalamin/alpha-ribazole phosphatase